MTSSPDPSSFEPAAGGDSVNSRQAPEHEPSANLSETETREVDKRGMASPRVVHEVVRLQGEEELDRSSIALALSAFAAGVSISFSVLAKAALHQRLPANADWAPLVDNIGYSVGFVVVIMGRLQLFTETTVTAVLPVATKPTLGNLGRLAKIWTVVLLANLLGTLAVAAMIAHATIIGPEARASVVAIARVALAPGFWDTMFRGMPAGFLVASIAWILPNARGSEFWVIVLITWLVGVGEFSHVVAGSTEAFTLWLTGNITFDAAIDGYVVPALIGNIIGGTGLFALFAHGQVRDEI